MLAIKHLLIICTYLYDINIAYIYLCEIKIASAQDFHKYRFSQLQESRVSCQHDHTVGVIGKLSATLRAQLQKGLTSLASWASPGTRGSALFKTESALKNAERS